MALGMSYDEYWYGELDRADYYIEAYKIRHKMKLSDADIIAYRSAEYVTQGICCCFDRKHQFPSKPYGFKFDDCHTAEALQQKAESEMRNYLLGKMK